MPRSYTPEPEPVNWSSARHGDAVVVVVGVVVVGAPVVVVAVVVVVVVPVEVVVVLGVDVTVVDVPDDVVLELRPELDDVAMLDG